VETCCFIVSVVGGTLYSKTSIKSYVTTRDHTWPHVTTRHHTSPHPRKQHSLQFKVTLWHLYHIHPFRNIMALNHYPKRNWIARYASMNEKNGTGRYSRSSDMRLLCVISDLCLDVDEICALLGHHAVYSGNSLPMCRHNVSVPSSCVKKSKKKSFFLDFLTPWDKTVKLSRNIITVRCVMSQRSSDIICFSNKTPN